MLGDSHRAVDMGSQARDSEGNNMPLLRIGLIEHRDTIEFRLSGRFSVLNDQGIAILKDVTSNVKWRVKIQQRQPSKFTYNIVLGKFQERQKAQELEYQLIEKGIGTRIKVRGGKLYSGDQVVNDNTQFWVVVDGLNSDSEAQRFAKERLAEFQYQIINEKLNEPHALLELFDSEFEKLGEADNVLRIVPESSEVTTYIYDVMHESELQHRPIRYRLFCGPLEFRCSNNGKAIIICELPLEKYITSVVALEMKSDFPSEVIKAQAIAVRSKTIAFLGIKHYDDFFHLCSGNHCQPFTGLVPTSEIILNAVRDTTGMVLKNVRQVIDADYSLICGGHTEAYHNLNQNDSGDPYPPIFDGPNANHTKNYGNLKDNNEIMGWVRDAPDVYCNLLNVPLNNKLNYVRSLFRWNVSYDRRELEEIISTKLGFDIGTLYDIIPICRGISGRILEIEIIASHKNLTIYGEQNICQILANDKLLSSCFVIDRHFDEQGFPMSFTIYGAGAGHGVGFCQAGGLALAMKGKDHAAILAHYFKDVILKKIY